MHQITQMRLKYECLTYGRIHIRRIQLHETVIVYFKTVRCPSEGYKQADVLPNGVFIFAFNLYVSTH